MDYYEIAKQSAEMVGLGLVGGGIMLVSIAALIYSNEKQSRSKREYQPESIPRPEERGKDSKLEEMSFVSK